MSFDADSLHRLLPAIHRIRDAERVAGMAGSLLTEAEKTELGELEGLGSPTSEQQKRIDELRKKASRGPLESLLVVFAEQIGVLEENLEQLYDNLFIETCADWVIPYIGDLIGYQGLYGVAPEVASPRAEVAHTIALRRRKGTALVLEQLARDVTGWNARAVEFFQRLATTQHMNHPRLHSLRCPDLRDAEALEWIGTAFESASRSVDVRHIESGRGRHNISSVGLFLWRIGDHRHSRGSEDPAAARPPGTPAVRAAAGRYRMSPLNHDIALYSHPRAEDDITHLAEPVNAPLPLTRRRLARHLDDYYGTRLEAGEETDNAAPSLILWVNGTLIERNQVIVCNLSDDGSDWAHTPPPAGRYAIDPELGRIALPPEVADPADVCVIWYEGFGADLGGGEYERGDSLPTPEEGVTVVRVPDDRDTLKDALDLLHGNGVVEITDSGRYVVTEYLSIQVNEGGTIEIRAANRCRPVLVLSEPLTVSGGVGSGFTVNGLLISGAGLHVKNDGANTLAELHLRHCTLVPGLALEPDGQPTQPHKPSLEVRTANLDVDIDRSILGGVRLDERSSLTATDSIIDATDPEGLAFAAVDGTSPGGRLSLESCTVVGKVHAREFGEVSNSILLAEADPGSAPVRTTRRQVGCVRFSFLPYTSSVPRRHRCQPDSAESARRVAPGFTSLRFGTPAYCQLRSTTPSEIQRGADDESEMGVFRHLHGAQREANLRIRLGEYLRVGLRAGIFYES